MSAPTMNGTRVPSDATLAQALSRHSRTEEMAVLGAMLLCPPSSATPGEVREILWPGEGQPGVGEHHFTTAVNKMIWQTIVTLMDRGDPHDANMVVAELAADQLVLINNGVYLVECQEACPAAGNGTYYARNVARATLLRGLVEGASRTVDRALKTALADADDVYDQAQTELDRLVVPSRGGALVAWEETGREAWEEMERLKEAAEHPDSAQPAEFGTPWIDLDRLLGPVAPGSLIIIAARPGLGKSVAARNIAQHLAMRKQLPAVLFSLEMGRLEIGLAMMAAGPKFGLPLQGIKNGTLSDDDWITAARYLHQNATAPLDIDDTPTMNLAYADRALAATRRKYGRPPAAYAWDYLQLGDERGHGGRQEAVSAMSRGHKLLAKKHHTVGVVLSQLNRGPEQRTDKRPQLSDLRESGSIEQDADIVILLHRDDYYDKECPTAGEIDFIVAKNRNGPTGTVTLAAQLHLSRIVSMARD